VSHQHENVWAELPVFYLVLEFVPLVHNYYLDATELEQIRRIGARQDFKEFISIVVECVQIWYV
jgi:hypothetical protein